MLRTIRYFAKCLGRRARRSPFSRCAMRREAIRQLLPARRAGRAATERFFESLAKYCHPFGPWQPRNSAHSTPALHHALGCLRAVVAREDTYLLALRPGGTNYVGEGIPLAIDGTPLPFLLGEALHLRAGDEGELHLCPDGLVWHEAGRPYSECRVVEFSDVRLELGHSVILPEEGGTGIRVTPYRGGTVIQGIATKTAANIRIRITFANSPYSILAPFCVDWVEAFRALTMHFEHFEWTVAPYGPRNPWGSLEAFNSGMSAALASGVRDPLLLATVTNTSLPQTELSLAESVEMGWCVVDSRGELTPLPLSAAEHLRRAIYHEWRHATGEGAEEAIEQLRRMSPAYFESALFLVARLFHYAQRNPYSAYHIDARHLLILEDLHYLSEFLMHAEAERGSFSLFYVPLLVGAYRVLLPHRSLTYERFCEYLTRFPDATRLVVSLIRSHQQPHFRKGHFPYGVALMEASDDYDSLTYARTLYQIGNLLAETVLVPNPSARRHQPPPRDEVEELLRHLSQGLSRRYGSILWDYSGHDSPPPAVNLARLVSLPVLPTSISHTLHLVQTLSVGGGGDAYRGGLPFVRVLSKGGGLDRLLVEVLSDLLAPHLSRQLRVNPEWLEVSSIDEDLDSLLEEPLHRTRRGVLVVDMRPLGEPVGELQRMVKAMPQYASPSRLLVLFTQPPNGRDPIPLFGMSRRMQSQLTLAVGPQGVSHLAYALKYLLNSLEIDTTDEMLRLLPLWLMMRFRARLAEDIEGCCQEAYRELLAGYAKRLTEARAKGVRHVALAMDGSELMMG